MVTIYNTHLQIKLVPVYFDKLPQVKISCCDQIEQVTLDQPYIFEFKKKLPAGNYKFELNFFNKTDDDSQGEKDMAVIIDSVCINGIEDEKFRWQGRYLPDYPSHYKQANPDVEESLKYVNYMGWNGKWILEFSVPIFTWMHNALDLGFIHPVPQKYLRDV